MASFLQIQQSMPYLRITAQELEQELLSARNSIEYDDAKNVPPKKVGC